MVSDSLLRALTELRKAALRDIEATCAQLLPILADNPDRTLANWSMRVSSNGFEVVEAELEDWLRSEDFTAPAYVFSFKEDDTLARLLSVITEYRESLVHLLEKYMLRSWGLLQRHEDNSFITAIETPPSQYQSACSRSSDLSAEGRQSMVADGVGTDIFSVP